ncbi:MAG: glucosyl-3-phosphoglycerate synthase [Acidimicrobiales bacterium]
MPVPAPLRRRHGDYYPLEELAEVKGATVVSVCLPARNEADTIGAIVAAIRRGLVDDVALVDELIVVDDHSSDRTADLAADAGAFVVQAADVLPEYGKGHGKGEALWKSLHVSRGDVVVWCDSDILDFDARFVTGLLGPLLTEPRVGFVKGSYSRPAAVAGEGGGRVTELVARPLLSLFFPELIPIVQPLAGEFAGRRTLLEQLPFVEGYGVDIGLLIDVVQRFGIEGVAQVDLGSRRHRNRSLDELSPQALAVAQTVLRRAGVPVGRSPVVLERPGLPPTLVDTAERPPLASVPGYRLRTA